ncbi:MAG: transglycosylase SLT domain-containing protein [Paracoccaceae bacterium]
MPFYFRTLGCAAGLALALIVPQAATALAATDPAAVCDEAARHAAQQTGVPVSVLQAITRTETGRRKSGAFRPWAWTVNMEGEGHWFDNEDMARAYVYKEYRRGARSFDVGCFQINFKWHGQEFASIDEMFDPIANALYAARFLKTLHGEKGTWESAAGAYHSRNKEFADRYQARFERIRSGLTGSDEAEIPAIPDIVGMANGGAAAHSNVPRINRYPLLQTGAPGSLASLVPFGNARGASLFDTGNAPEAE